MRTHFKSGLLRQAGCVSLHPFVSLVHSFTHSFIQSFIHSFIASVVPSTDLGDGKDRTSRKSIPPELG